MLVPRVDLLQGIARTMRYRAEQFARSKDYDDKTLVTMCSTVSAALELVLLHTGFNARMVAGDCDDEGHFWVEVLPSYREDDDLITLVDLTATQFEWMDPLPPPVVITNYLSSFGKRYTRYCWGRSRVRSCIRAFDQPDVAAFEAQTQMWLKGAQACQ